MVWLPVPLSRMRNRLYVHLVWTTRGRAPMIDALRAIFLGRYLGLVADQERAAVLALGMVTTHVHLLLRVVPATQLSRMIQRMKGGSSYLAGREGIGTVSLPLLWDEGYDLESVSPSALANVGDYVLRTAGSSPR